MRSHRFTIFVLLCSSIIPRTGKCETRLLTVEKDHVCSARCGHAALGGNTRQVYDLEIVFLHELMHALNVGHTWADSVMWPQYQDFFLDLQDADRGALMELYGLRPGVTKTLAVSDLYTIGPGTPWPKDPDGIARITFALDPELEVLSPQYHIAWERALTAVEAVAMVEFFERDYRSHPLEVDIFVRPLWIDGPGNLLGYSYYPTADFIERWSDDTYGDIYIDVSEQWVVAVPEPDAFVLGGIGVMTLLCASRRTVRRICG